MTQSPPPGEQGTATYTLPLTAEHGFGTYTPPHRHNDEPSAGSRPAALRVCFTVDNEPDCPPYLQDTFRGIEQGLPRLLDLLDAEGVPSTMFTTGDVARRYPEMAERIVAAGHELASHGMTHRSFETMSASEAMRELEESAAILRAFGSVDSFRAPWLRFPSRYLGLLGDAGYSIDSSFGWYKSRDLLHTPPPGLHRVGASITSSALRIPGVLRRLVLRRLTDPIVLFVHPWEFVDLRRERLRLDCRFRTGEKALSCARDVLRALRARGAQFVTMRDLVAQDVRRNDAAVR